MKELVRNHKSGLIQCLFSRYLAMEDKIKNNFYNVPNVIPVETGIQCL